MAKQRLYLMIGCPGSGKTTFAKNELIKLREVPCKYISRDDIRFSLIGDNIKDYFSREKEVYREFIWQIYSALKEGKDVIADATHLNTKSRQKFFNNLPFDKNNIEVVAVFIDTPLEICIQRNETRKGQKTYVPENSLRKMFFARRPPTLQECNQIFDIILTINEKGYVKNLERKAIK